MCPYCCLGYLLWASVSCRTHSVLCQFKSARVQHKLEYIKYLSLLLFTHLNKIFTLHGPTRCHLMSQIMKKMTWVLKTFPHFFITVQLLGETQFQSEKKCRKDFWLQRVIYDLRFSVIQIIGYLEVQTNLCHFLLCTENVPSMQTLWSSTPSSIYLPVYPLPLRDSSRLS